MQHQPRSVSCLHLVYLMSDHCFYHRSPIVWTYLMMAVMVVTLIYYYNTNSYQVEKK